MLEVGCAAGPGGKSDSGLTIEETRSHFGGWAIVSSPLTLSHDVNNNTLTAFIWDVISNKEVIAINQNYFGFSGSAFKNSYVPPATPGAFVVALPCSASDATQKGWAYDASAKAITFGGQCVDAATEDQLLLAACSGAKTQEFSHATKEFVSAATSECLDVWSGNGPPGGPAVQVYECNNGPNQAWLVSGGTIADDNSLCLTSRSSVPGQLSYYFKPQSWDGSKFAILLMNTDDSTADLTFAFADVPGLVGTKCDVRDVWQHADVGSATGSYTAAGVASHDSAFLMITCQ